MKYPWIHEYLTAKKGVESDLKAEWNWIRYMIDGKMFAAVCLSEEGKPQLVTLKLLPEEGAYLRTQYEDVIPGYYMNKTHWNSIRADGNVPDELLKELLDKSYLLILRSLPQKRQAEITG